MLAPVESSRMRRNSRGGAGRGSRKPMLKMWEISPLRSALRIGDGGSPALYAAQNFLRCQYAMKLGGSCRSRSPGRRWGRRARTRTSSRSVLTADHETTTAAVAAFRMLLVPRACLPIASDRAPCKPRIIGAIAPWIDGPAKQRKLSGNWSNHLIAPLPSVPKCSSAFAGTFFR